MSDGVPESRTARYRRAAFAADDVVAEQPLPRWMPTRERPPKDASCSECEKPIEERGKGLVWIEVRTGKLAHRPCALAARGRAAAASAL